MRRSVLVILIGAIASLTGFTAIDYLRGRRCGELLGSWNGTTRLCTLPTGEVVGTGTLVIFMIGVVIAAGVGFMLYRMMLFATGRFAGTPSGS